MAFSWSQMVGHSVSIRYEKKMHDHQRPVGCSSESGDRRCKRSGPSSGCLPEAARRGVPTARAKRTCSGSLEKPLRPTAPTYPAWALRSAVSAHALALPALPFTGPSSDVFGGVRRSAPACAPLRSARCFHRATRRRLEYAHSGCVLPFALCSDCHGECPSAPAARSCRHGSISGNRILHSREYLKRRGLHGTVCAGSGLWELRWRNRDRFV